MSSIKVLYFAKLREQLDCAEETYSLTSAPYFVAQLKQNLAERGGAWGKIFTDPNLLVAVNQVMASADVLLQRDDEVGFFPLVTGG